MCISDWRIGRLITSVTHNLATMVTPSIILPPNRQRVGVSFFGLGFSDVNDPDFLVTMPDGSLIAINRGLPYLHLTLQSHGDLPTRQFTITDPSDSDNGTVIEYFMPEQYLSAALDSFRREYNFGG